MIKATFWMICLGLVGAVSSARAVTPILWEQNTQRDFQLGVLSQVSISAKGLVTLAPPLETWFDSAEPLLWNIVLDQKGNLFVGSGNDGKVFKVNDSGKGQVFFDTEELGVHALAVDRGNNLFVGTFPDGKVYRITPTGEAEVFFDPPDRYIWCLAFGPSGDLYVATGDKGIIYRVTPKGESSVFADTDETHIMSLAFDSQGALLAGSADNGYIYRITKANQLFVLYDAPLPEIRTLAVDDQGQIFAVAVESERPTKMFRPRRDEPEVSTLNEGQARPPDGGGDRPLEITVETPTIRPAGEQRPGRTVTNSRIYRIDHTGWVDEIWKSTTDLVLSLIVDQSRNRLIVGTGHRGMIHTLNQDAEITVLAQAEESQITALTLGKEGIFAAASNLGKVLRIGTTYVSEGTLESQVKDTQVVSRWGQIHWVAQTPPGTEVVLQTRSGNTEFPDNTWSSWSPPYRNQEGEYIKSPAARFIQWRAVLKTSNPNRTPLLEKVSVAYLEKNGPPKIEAITIHPPGIYYARSGGEKDQREANYPPPIAAALGRGSRTSDRTSRRTFLGNPTYQQGMRTISWHASDPNGDDLIYTLAYRAVGERLWKNLATDLQGPSYTWNTTALPDGTYQIKLSVSDHPSNPANLALQQTREGKPFKIDNTPPQIQLARPKISGPTARFSFRVEDRQSLIFRVSYAVDGGPWQIIHPDDGIYDALQEVFTLEQQGLASGEHALVVQATDMANNAGTGKILFAMP